MVKTVYYTASSLDGFIVDTEDSLDWLITRNIDQHGAFGYDEFIKTVGALVMGSTTYEWIVKNHPDEWGYEQPTWVLTHRPEIISPEYPVQVFSGDIAELHPKLVEAAAGKDVWVVGGGERRGPVRHRGSDRRDDRQLRTLHTGRGSAGPAGPLGVGAGRVCAQR